MYAPLGLRCEAGALDERDYRVVSDPGRLDELCRSALAAIAELKGGRSIGRERGLEVCFGPTRLTYRAGCELVRRIERDFGMDRVRRAFHLDGRSCAEECVRLLNSPDADV